MSIVTSLTVTKSEPVGGATPTEGASGAPALAVSGGTPRPPPAAPRIHCSPPRSPPTKTPESQLVMRTLRTQQLATSYRAKPLYPFSSRWGGWGAAPEGPGCVRARARQARAILREGARALGDHRRAAALQPCLPAHPPPAHQAINPSTPPPPLTPGKLDPKVLKAAVLDGGGEAVQRGRPARADLERQRALQVHPPVAHGRDAAGGGGGGGGGGGAGGAGGRLSAHKRERHSPPPEPNVQPTHPPTHPPTVWARPRDPWCQLSPARQSWSQLNGRRHTPQRHGRQRPPAPSPRQPAR